jgi:uncharacterized protein (UPF0335 family)
MQDKNEISQAVPKYTKKQHLDRLIALLQEQDGLSESLKGIKDNIKNDKFDVKSLVAVAKAVVKNKEQDLKDYVSLLEESLELV